GPPALLQSEHIAAEAVRPEITLEASAQRRRLRRERLRPLPVIGQRQQPRARMPRAIEIALDFAERNRWRGKRPVCIGDGDTGVFPALVDEAASVGAAVIEIAVAIAVAETLDPIQRRVDVAPQGADQPDVSRPRKILIEEDEEEWSRIHGPVVGRALRNLPEARERPLAQLVCDLPGLGIAVRIAAIRLIARQHARGVAGDGRTDPTDLERGNGGIAAEEGREPRDPGADVVLATVQRRAQELQVEKAAAHDA